jgi:CheY-like chemotaxis protein
MSEQGCGRTVLVVEDDTDIREAIAEVLADGDYRTLCAANGADALTELRAAQRQPCVILLDVMMPIMDGREFRAQQVRDAALRNIPVVVLSAHAHADADATQMDAAGFLAKPVDLHVLLRTVEQFCARDAGPSAPAG